MSPSITLRKSHIPFSIDQMIVNKRNWGDKIVCSHVFFVAFICSVWFIGLSECVDRVGFVCWVYLPCISTLSAWYLHCISFVSSFPYCIYIVSILYLHCTFTIPSFYGQFMKTFRKHTSQVEMVGGAGGSPYKPETSPMSHSTSLIARCCEFASLSCLYVSFCVSGHLPKTSNVGSVGANLPRFQCILCERM